MKSGMSALTFGVLDAIGDFALLLAVWRVAPGTPLWALALILLVLVTIECGWWYWQWRDARAIRQGAKRLGLTPTQLDALAGLPKYSFGQDAHARLVLPALRFRVRRQLIHKLNAK